MEKPAAKTRKVITKMKKPVVKDSEPEDDYSSNDENSFTANTTNTTTSKSKKAAGGSKTVEEIYQKKTQLEHILLRPDTYIGSVEAISLPMWIFEDNKMVYRPVNYVPGLYKIFDEIIVNAADNKVRDPSMNTMKINIDKEANRISIYNNGRGIPIEVHKTEGVYVPELIFGHLLTSSNYDDDEKKITGGRNGYGAKLCNIFSTEFTVETADSISGKKFKQTFSDNMSSKTKPSITENKKNEDFTLITFKPDLRKFGMTTLDSDIEALFKKRAYDMAGCIPNVNVYLNDVKIKIKDFKQYVDLYISSTEKSDAGAATRPGVIYQKFGKRWEVAVTSSDGQFQQVSFVNSICTSKGGNHVNYIADQVVSTLLDAVKKKDKKGVPLKPFQAKTHLWVFVNCLIENPSFDSQTKENMTLRASAFGSKCALDDEFMKKVLKSGIVETILSFAQFKQQQALKKSDGKKHTRITGIAKLDDANNAGTKNGSNCTLILTEGDSAKSLAVSGLGIVGRDNYGVFPLRGKLLNVREASHSQIMNNAEINAVKQILGLKHGTVYKDTSSLRYGHLMIMTDQDHDGSHIKGLIINFLDHFWPSLLKLPNFLLEFITPIVKVSKGKGKKEHSFFTIPEYESWKEENDNGKGWTIKYYKGLGTSTTDDAKKYFSDLNQHRKEFKGANENDRSLIDMAFSKKKADDRKEWLRQFTPGTYMDHSQAKIPISDFVNNELILFSMADNARSIPNMVDGLKPGHRKIMFSCFKRNLKTEIKVAQLAGYVSEHSAYHHGEASLCGTIVNLAQSYVGSNNMPLLEPLGQFGTRLQGGKDAASPRYIFTNLSPLARAVYHPADDALLTYLNEDGQNIEPEWYMPVLPLVLINGAEGIGTGYSTFIPNFNPRDIVQNLFKKMEGAELEKLHPWYRGFRGTIEQVNADKYKISGTITKLNNTTVEITELPIRSWTQGYKEQLEEWMVGGAKTPAWILDYKEYHTDSRVHFVVTLTEDQLAKAEAEGLEKKFKLTTTVSLTNIVCFDLEGRIKKYDKIDDIFDCFYDLRLKYYQKRKDHLLDQLTNEWNKLDNRVRFVLEIIEGKLIVSNRKKADLLLDLKKRDYLPIYKKKVNAEQQDDVEQDEEASSDHGYDYLLTMPIWNLTMEKVSNLTKEKLEKENEVTVLSRRSPKDLWKTDLDAFLVKWEQFEAEMDQLENQKAGKPGKKGNKAVKKQIKKKLMSDDEDEMSLDGDSEDDAFEVPKKEVVAKSKAKPKTTAAKAPKVKKEAVVESQIESVTASVSSLSIDNPSKDVAPKKRILKKKVAAAPAPPIKDDFIVDSDEDEITASSSKSSKKIVLSSDGEVAPVAKKQPTSKPVKKKAVATKAAPAKKAAASSKKSKKIVIPSSSEEASDITETEDSDIEEVEPYGFASKSSSKTVSAAVSDDGEEEVVEKKVVLLRKREKAAYEPKYVVDSAEDDQEEDEESEFEFRSD